MPRALRVLGAVVAPTTLVTALLVYFGRLHLTGLFRYFRVSITVLDFSVQDYLVRSADGLFVPVVVAAGALLAGVWGHATLVRWTSSELRARVIARSGPVAAVLGAALLAAAVAVVAGADVFPASPEIPGLCLAGGALLMACAMRIARRGRPASAPVVVAEWAGLFVVVAVGLFWSVGNYAIGVGTARAQQIVDALPTAPAVVLYSDKDLGLSGSGITVATCGDPAEPTAHRYTGLTFVIESGGRLLLLPRDWTRSDGEAVLVQHSDGVSMIFAPAGSTPSPSC